MTIINPFLIGSGSTTPPQDFYIQTYVVTFGPLPPGMQVYDLTPAWILPRATLPGQPALTWTQTLVDITLVGQDKFPPGARFYDLSPAWYLPRATLPGQPAITWAQSVLDTPLIDLSKIFRPHYRSLPDQPPQPLTPSWVQSNIALTSVAPKPTSQLDWPNPTPPFRIEQTWTWQYNLNLIGKDSRASGIQIYDLVPAQRPPEQVQLHYWSWSYNLNLIGKDRLPTGAQVYVLAPGQLPPPPENLRRWEWSYNLNLIGKDRLPAGEQFYELVPRLPAGIFQQWLNAVNLALTFPKPFAQYDWPLTPAAQQPDRFWTIFSDALLSLPVTTGVTLRSPLYTQHVIPTLLQTWIQNVNILLTVPVQKPFAQYDWPLTPAAIQPERTVAASYNKNLIAQDKMVTGQQATDLPPRDYARLFQTWIETVNLALTVTPPNIFAQARQQDWPVPRGVEPDWRRSWEWSYNRNLIAQDQLPFRQTDWPNQVQPAQVKDWIQSTNIALLAVQKPFAQYDWPLTSAAQQPDRSIAASYNRNLIGQDRLPAGAKIFDLWPAGPQQPDRGFGASYNRNLVGQDQLPNRQTDWPLSPGHITQLLQITPLGTIVIRFPVVPLPPGAIFTGRPELGPAPLLQQSVYEYNVAFIPAPTAPTLILRTLTGTGL